MEVKTMNIKTVINSHNFDADQKLLDFIQTKVNKLGLFFDGIVEADVYLRVENSQQVENKTAEIRLLIPGDDIFIKKTAKSFEAAMDEVIESGKRQLKKRKEKVRGV